MWFNQYQFITPVSHWIYFYTSNPTKLAIPLNLNSLFFKKNWGNYAHLWSTLKEYERFKIKLPPILGAIPLPIWSLTCHHRMFVHPPIPTHASNVRIDCINNFVSSIKICECSSQNENSKLNKWIQWFHKNIRVKESGKIANQNHQALKVKISCESKFHASA